MSVYKHNLFYKYKNHKLRNNHENITFNEKRFDIGTYKTPYFAGSAAENRSNYVNDC